MPHLCEPTPIELKQILRGLFSEESTPENMKKIDAVQRQIARKEKEEAAG